MTVRLSPQGAQVIRSGCRDQVCVRTGLITRAGEALYASLLKYRSG